MIFSVEKMVSGHQSNRRTETNQVQINFFAGDSLLPPSASKGLESPCKERTTEKGSVRLIRYFKLFLQYHFDLQWGMADYSS